MPLPLSPSTEPERQWSDCRLEPLRMQSEPTVTGRGRFLLYSLGLLWLAASITFWTWWLRPERVLSWSFYAAFTVAFAYYATVLPGMCLFFVGRMRRPCARPAPLGMRVAMVTTCVPSCESLDLIERQLVALANVTYPHDSWVLDDEGVCQVRELAERYGVRYFSRAGITNYNQPGAPFQTKTKAGNVNAWLNAWGAAYDFFVQLDVDHRPHPDYLDHVLGFFRDPDVAWVQAPSVYRNLATWVSRGAAEQELIFQGPLQQGFYGHAEMPFIIGSHTSYRTSAVLKIGGFQPTRAEDHLDTVVLAAHGYRGVFVPEVIAQGDGPETFDVYLRQQFAWARSIMQILFGYTPKLLRRLQVRQAIQVLFTETWYLLWSASLLIMFALPIISLVTGSGPSKTWFPEFLARSWPMPLITLLLWLWSRQWHVPTGLQLSWRGVLLNAARWPVVLWAFVTVLLHLKRPYMITPKGQMRRKAWPEFRLRTHLPYLLGVWLSCGSISVTLTQRAYAGNGGAWVGDSGVLGPALLALWGALFMFGVYAVNAIENVSRAHRSGIGSWEFVRAASVPILVLAVSLTLFAAAAARVGGALVQTVADQWPPSANLVSQPQFAEMPSHNAVETTTNAAPLPLDLPDNRIAVGGYDPLHKLTEVPLDLQHFYVRQDDVEGLKKALSITRNWRVPLITVEPYSPPGDDRPVLDTVVLGYRDSQIANLADVAAASKPQVIYVRWGQEMDLSGLYPWAANNPAMFRAAFRHVVSLFREHGATNVKWLWSPAGVKGAEAYYPGDDVVDFIGLTILEDSKWDHGYDLPPQSFIDLVAPKYDVVQRFEKPVIIAELGVSGDPQRQRQWLSEVPSGLHDFPLIRGVVYFDSVNSANNRMPYRPDWRIPPNYLNTLAQALAPEYRSR